MSTPPVNYGTLPPGVNRMNLPPSNIRPQPSIQPLPPPAYGSPMPVYPHSYNQSNYPPSYSYYPYERLNLPPPTVNHYLPPPPPPYYPPRPLGPPASVSYREPHYSYKKDSAHNMKESLARPPPVKTNVTETPPASLESTSKGSNEDNPFKGPSSSKRLSPQREQTSIDRGEHSREGKLLREREHDRRELSRYKERDKYREDSEDRRRDMRHRGDRSRSPSYSSHRYRSPSRYSEREQRMRDKHYDRYRDERQRERERYYEEIKEYERKRREYQNFRSPVRIRDVRSTSRSSDYHRRVRSPSRSSYYSHRNESRSRTREPSHLLRDEREREGSKKPLTDREKILEEYSKNYCRTSEDLIAKVEQWSKEHQPDEEEPKLWYRCSPAELYYKHLDGVPGIEQTKKLETLLETFFNMLIMRGRNARPAVDELPPLKTRPRMCSKHGDKSSSSSSSSEESDIDEEGLQGYSDRIMLELERKQSHPRRLHPEMWFNNPGEMNGGPLCRCSVRARRFGMRHGVYAGEQGFPRCTPTQNNIDKLYHYRITVSPPTNFLIKNPTIIGHDEHEFLFSGFSMFSHYKLAELPTCKVIRFNIEYTILYVEEPAPENFTVQELDYFEDFLFTELLELIDLDLGKATDTSCSQFHFMPRFVRLLAEGGCEVLSMCEVMKYLIDESGLLIPPATLDDVHSMDHYTWQKFVDKIKGMIVTYPGRKPCSVRVDQLDRSPPVTDDKEKDKEVAKKFFPEIVHFGIRPPQLSYAGNPEYQKAWRYYVKYRHLIANMAKPTYKERSKLAVKEAKLQEMRTQSKMKRDVTVAISSEGFHTTGLMCDVVQHGMLIPVLVRHLRFHKSLEALETKLGYVFKQRLLLQTALTHPSYRENFGTNPDHARNSLTNCGIRQPEYGDRRIHYTRKKGIVTLINIMSRFGKRSETESEIKHNERLEFLGDAVVEFLSSIHLFRMFPGLAEGGLATYRASIVQNQHLAQLAKNIELEQFMLYAHGSDLCREVVMKHAMANCFEALMGALFLDAGLQVADRVFALALWFKYPDLYDVWLKERPHPLQEQEPLGDRQYIKDFEFLQKLTEFETSIGLEFKHIRLLARAFTDRSVGFTHLTLGSNQRLEFLGDTVLQLVVSDRLYRHFPDHHEGHLSLLRSSLVNNRTQSMVCDDLDMSTYAIYNNPKAKPTTKKHKADLLEAFLGALYIDKSLDYCIAFCNACLFPRLQEFIMNQDWNDPKSKLQQCCLTLRSMEGGEPDIPLYKVIECIGPTNTRVYTVGVYFRGVRLASSRGHSIQDAEMNAASVALNNAHELFPQLDHQKRVIAKSMRRKKKDKSQSDRSNQASRQNDRVPKAYRNNQNPYDSDESSINEPSDEEDINNLKNDDSGLDSEAESLPSEKTDNIEISSLLNDMEKTKAEMIRKNQYDKLKEKCRRSESDDE